MHIPDGMLSTPVAAATGAASIGFVSYAVSWTRRTLSEQRTVLMSVMSALVFALQMLNFPIAPGISGHFAGGAAVAILLGPWPAVIVMTTVLGVQAFMFADGGIVALGANVLNLAVIGPFSGYLVWSTLTVALRSNRGRLVASFASGWTATVLAASAVAVEVWLSGRVPLGPALAALGGWHAVVGIGEGVITAGLVAFVVRMRPDLLGPGPSRRSAAGVAVSLGAIALAAAALSWLASSRPDALEYVAALVGFEGGGSEGWTLLPDYAVPIVSSDALAGVLAGVVGAVVAGLVIYGLGSAAQRRRTHDSGAGIHEHGHAHESEPVHEHPHHHRADAHEHAHPLSFERFTYVLSPVHNLDPRAKTIAALIFVLGVVLGPPVRPVELLCAVLLLAGLTMLARLPVSAVFGRSLWVLIPAVTITLFAPFTEGGWSLAWSVVTKAWLSALAVLLLSATTPPPLLLTGLRHLGLPQVFVVTLTFLYRFVSVLSSQIAAMRRAIASRGTDLSGLSLVPVYGHVAGSLFLRTYERGERIHAAMLSRGFSGTLPSNSELHLGSADAAAIALAAASALALVLY